MERDKRTVDLLVRVADGDESASEEVMPLVYAELRQIAGRLMATQGGHVVLQPTALVHEAYLKLLGASEVRVQDRAHFRALAARAMRQVLSDHVRGQERIKRGAGWHRISLSEASDEQALTGEVDFAGLESGLAELGRRDARAVRVVVLRFFGGLQVDEVATVLKVSASTVRDDWRMARAWLHSHLNSAQ